MRTKSHTRKKLIDSRVGYTSDLKMQSMSYNVIYNLNFTDNILDACDDVLCEDVRST